MILQKKEETIEELETEKELKKGEKNSQLYCIYLFIIHLYISILSIKNMYNQPLRLLMRLTLVRVETCHYIDWYSVGNRASHRGEGWKLMEYSVLITFRSLNACKI